MAQDGKKMTFQGSLFQTDQPFNGTTSLEFSIMLDSVTTWSETLSEVTVVNGLYSVVLGETTPLPANLFEGVSERMLNVKVDGTDLGSVALYAPFSAGEKPMLPLDLPGANGNRSVMLSSEGETGDDGTFRLSNADGFSRVTMYANGYENEYDSAGTASRVWTGAGGAWFGGANGTMGVRVGSDGVDNSNGFLELGDKEGAPQVRAGIREFEDGFARGEINLHNNTDGRNSVLRPGQLYFLNNDLPYPAGWYGTLGGSGFSQLVGYDSMQNVTGAMITGFWGGGSPQVYMEDENAQMKTYLGIDPGSTGRLELKGTDGQPNMEFGGKWWEDDGAGGNRPFFNMAGGEDVYWYDDNGTPSDSSDDQSGMNRPNLVWMDVQKWDNGTELGQLTLSSSDGTSLHISPYGIDGLNMDYSAKEFVLEHEWSEQRVGNLIGLQDGGQINIGGLINQGDTATSYGGGFSAGTKFWEGSPQLGYIHLRGTVNDENYFGANMKFSMEAVNHGETEEAEFKMYGSELDEYTNSKVVLRMQSIRNEAGQSAAEIIADGSSSPNFALGAKMWEDDGVNRPYMRMNGSVSLPGDTIDSVATFYHPDLVWMDVTKWDDGTERGHLHLNGNGNTHTMEDWIDEVRNHGNTYTQQLSHVFRVKNDNDPFSAVYLNRFDDGHARLQVAGHNNGEATGVGYLGANHNGGYMYIGGTDPRNNLRGGMYVADNLPHLFMQGTFDVEGEILQDQSGADSVTYYRPELVNMDLHNEDGMEYGSLTLRGTDGSEMHISSHGISGVDLDYKAKEFVLEHEWSDQQVGNIIGLQDGGQINIGGLISNADTTIYGGGFSAGSKFWEGNPQLGYVHVRGTVNEANYFDANIKFAMEAVNHGDYEGAEFRMYGNNLDGNNAAKPVFHLNTVQDAQGNSGSHISGEGSDSPNFALGAKDWEDNGANRPYFRMNGATALPGDTIDAVPTFYHPDLVWMDVQDWGDKEVGGFTLRSTDGAEFGFNAYGFTGTVEHLNVNDLVSYGNQWRMSSFGLNGDENAEFNVVEINNGQNLGTGAGEIKLFANDGSNGAMLDGWGNATFTGEVTATTLTQSSDKRFKKDINQIEGALSKISGLNGYTYFWNRTANEEKGIKDESQQIGLIAQEVEKVFPQLVKTDDEGFKSVNYAQMTAVLIEAVKELNAKVETLESENTDLKAQVEASANLENRLEQIEKLLGVKINETSSANNK